MKKKKKIEVLTSFAKGDNYLKWKKIFKREVDSLMYLYKKTGKVGSTVPASPGQARFMCEFIVAGYIKRIDPD